MTGGLLFRDVRLGPGEPGHDVRVAGGLVVEVAAAGGLRRAGEQVREGGALLPGLVDGHLHLTTWATSLGRVDLSGARTAVEAAGLLAAVPGASSGYGFRDALWPQRPHKDVLAGVLGDRAVVLVSADLHTVWFSPPALRRLGVDHPTGVLRDEEGLALLARWDALRPVAEVDAAVQAATAVLAGRGVTGVLDFEYADGRTDWLRRLTSADPLIRVTAATWAPWLEGALERTGEPVAGHDRLRQGPLKVMVDGSLNTRTAACHDAYPDPADGYGLLLVEPEELTALMTRAAARGLSTAAHAIGDRAVGVVLDAFEAVGCAGRVEHVQQIRAQDLGRLARSGLVASVQPQHAMADRDVAAVHWPERESLAFGYGAMHRAGAVLQLGSDAPVSPPDPWAAISDAVTRTDDGRPPWHPEQALPPEVALRAACGGRDRVRAGDVADLVHTAEHPLELAAGDLRALPVRTTVVAGAVTYRLAL